jgi:DNA polymerase
VKCRPPGNRDPRPDEVAACRPYLTEQIELVDPLVIVPLGNAATRLLLGTKEGITKLRGRQFPYRGRSMIVPALHPAAVLRGGSSARVHAEADFAAIRAVLDELVGTNL